ANNLAPKLPDRNDKLYIRLESIHYDDRFDRTYQFITLVPAFPQPNDTNSIRTQTRRGEPLAFDHRLPCTNLRG
ncbi:MAG: hypothetical protein ACK5EO_03405, partial [Planctomycetota bacterium]